MILPFGVGLGGGFVVLAAIGFGVDAGFGTTARVTGCVADGVLSASGASPPNVIAPLCQ